MTVIGLGDRTQTLLLQRRQTELKIENQTLSTEVSTGIAKDTGTHLKGNVATLAGIQASLTRLDGLRTANAQTTLVADTIQTALGTLGDIATEIGAQLSTAASGTSQQSVDELGVDAHQRFASAVSLLNARVGDKTVFAGTKSDSAAVAPADDILAALTTATGGATTAADVAQIVSDWFDDPSGYGAVAYQGGDSRAAVAIGQDERAAISVTANDPAIRGVLKGLAMAALLDTGTLAGDTSARAELAARAGETLATAETGRAYLSAQVGTVQARIESAVTRNESERSALQVSRSDLIGVDSYEAGTRIDEIETQLKLLYTLTSRMGNLSLLDYL